MDRDMNRRDVIKRAGALGVGTIAATRLSSALAQDATPASAATPDTTAEGTTLQGTITVTRGESATVHTYTAPDGGAVVTTHVIELADELVILDAQLLLPFAQEAATYARNLNKPISRLYISHQHPDHFFGASAFGDGVDIYALPEIKDTIEQHGDDEIAQFRAQVGELVPERATKPGKVVEPGDEVIGGARFEFRRVEDAESAVSLTIGLPDEDILMAQDLLFNNVHLWVAERRFHSWAANVNRYAELPYQRLLAGHGLPGGREIYDRVLEYLVFAEPALETADEGKEFKQALVGRFPDYEGDGLIDLQNFLYLFPSAE